jgi:hypothetical protein
LCEKSKNNFTGKDGKIDIEPAFKRLKSLFKHHETPACVEASARAWFHGKLSLAALCETWVDEGRFSPSEGRGG